ncbi:MAG: type I DNA topoisomerase [Candidatus Nealsonbacteria bacterium]|nr:type I DNA topoisomerase [Candidatus Nealsonbacteria bacterium]
MSTTLLIVESPTKAKTLQGFLGPKYKVLSSYGHVRDLPKSELGVDVEKNFQPKYVIPAKARKNLKILIEAVKKTDSTILATDQDREGEAISWHLIKALKLDGDKEPYQRIVFHEITKQAIEEALKNPGKLNMNLVDAQQARRILDRIVGYKLSPFLWKKVARGLSAGRVQSVAVRLVVEREREIEKFKPEEYWTISAALRKLKENCSPQLAENSSQKTEFEAALIKKNEEVLDKLAIKNIKESEKIIKDLDEAKYAVGNVEKKETGKNPFPPFTTSTLQQEAWRKFKFPAKFTMRLAQNLYEKGFITYHRTDSFNLSDLALGAAKKFITENYGKNYYQFRKYKAKGRAQEAHEAIRPAYPEKIAVETDEAGAKLYDLIWKRFMACQMSQAIFDSTTVDIETGNPKYTFRATGQTLKFDGFLKVYPIKYEETELPSLENNELLELLKLTPLQHFTQPPARYSEASLIKALESEGVGRPSTYAPTISTIQERNYIEKNERKFFKPTEIGIVVNDLLVKHFPEIVDIKFTASMEEDLDKIADGEKKWVKVLEEFYGPFEKNLEKKYKDVSKKEYTEEPTNKKCPKCGAPLLIRMGRYGKFYACSKFPECKYTESLPENVLNIKCPKCGEGQIVEKRTAKRKIFYGCNQYPKCDFALWDKPLPAEKCPKCGSLLVETKRKQIKCSGKECDYIREPTIKASS